jgi:hypothetical protein
VVEIFIVNFTYKSSNFQIMREEIWHIMFALLFGIHPEF